MTNNLKKLINNGAEFVVPQGDMEYSDFDFVTKTGNSITLDLRTYIEPTANFTINAPSIIEDGQEYVLRVKSGATAYTMSLGPGIDNNTWNVDLTLQAKKTSQFVFLGIDGELELQPEVVLSVNNKSGNVTVSEFTPSNTGDTGQVIKKTADGYEWANETGTTYTAGTGISISNGEISNTGIVSSEVSDTAYASSWDGVTTTAPSKNAVYDKISAMDTTIGNKANSSDVILKTASGTQTVNSTTSSQTTPFGIKSNNASSYLSFSTSAGWKGSYGVSSTGQPVYYNGTGYTLAYTSDIPDVSGFQTTANLKTNLTDNSDTYYPSQKAVKTAVDGKQDTLVSGTNIKTINGNSILGSGNLDVSGGGGETYTAGENIEIDNNVISANNLYIIHENDVTVSTDATKGVEPYNTSYGYTNFDISANAGIKWVEGALYTFVVNTTMVVAGDYRNVRVKIGTGSYIPVMGSSAILAGSSYFVKTQTRCFQYSTKYQSGGALHLITDSNTTYSSMTVAEINAGTGTTARLITPARLKTAIQTWDTNVVNDTAYASSWNGVTTIAPSKNAVYDKISAMDTTISGKQNALSSQTAYTSKGTSTKVPTITTNSLGQVTAISETSISFPVTSVNGSTGAVTGLQTTANLKTSLSDNSDSYYPSQKAVKTAVDGKQETLVSGTNIKTINGNSLLGSGDITISGGTDYSWVTKTISSGSVEIGLRTIVDTPASNFTLTKPATLKDGEEYVLRTISGATAYTITLGTGFTNPRNVSLTLSQYATDQFVFIAIGGKLELQPLVATGS